MKKKLANFFYEIWDWSELGEISLINIIIGTGQNSDYEGELGIINEL